MRIGTRAVATARIIEENFRHARWHHAVPGDQGTIVHVDTDGALSVRWDRTGTVTLCFPGEFQVMAA